MTNLYALKKTIARINFFYLQLQQNIIGTLVGKNKSYTSSNSSKYIRIVSSYHRRARFLALSFILM